MGAAQAALRVRATDWCDVYAWQGWRQALNTRHRWCGRVGMIRLRAILATLLVLLVPCAIAYAITGAGVGVFTDAAITPNQVQVVGAVVRNEGSGWYLIEGTHQAMGIDSVACNPSTGYLTLYLDPDAAQIVSVWIDTDETLSRRGIMAGASVTPSTISVLFTDNTGNGPVAVGCGNVDLQGPSANLWVGGVFLPA